MSTNELWFQSGGGFYDHQIDGSLRFDDDGSHYLSGGISATISTYTVSYWFKRSTITSGNYQYMFSTRSNGGISIGSTAGQVDEIYVYNAGGGNVQYLGSGRKFTDPSAWYHLVMKVSSGAATVYINGEQLGTATAGSVDSNAMIGQYAGGGSFYFDGYIAEFNFIDGQALDPTSFGETKSGVWIPKAYSGSYGTNGFHLEFAGNTNDSSGNGNNWTANNISSYDYVPDSPTNNFCTWNGVNKGFNVTTYEANTYARQTASSSGVNQSVTGSMGAFSGKWYFEAYAVNVLSGYGQIVGIAENDYSTINGFAGSNVWGYRPNGQKQTGSTLTNYGATYTSGDIIGVALDIDGGTLTFYKNGVSQGVAFTGLSGGFVPHAGMAFASSQGNGYRINAGQDSTFAGQTTAGGNSDGNGYGDFKYSVPSGYLALCTANLPVTEAVDPAEDNSPADYFNTVLYTGTGTTQSITGAGFQPDFMWVKNRSGTQNNYLQNVVTGATSYLVSNNTGAENQYSGFGSSAVTSFDSDGFSLGTDSIGMANTSSQTYASWNWKAGGSGVSNTDGSITSTVSANTESGFSIVSYTANGVTGATIGHGLTQAPDLVIYKRRDSGGYSWVVYSRDIGAVYNLRLNTTSAKINQTTQQFNSTDPSSSVLTVGSSTGSTNGPSGATYIAYCFHSVDGFSQFGTYTGLGNANGAFVYTGFRPAFVMSKRTNATGNWQIQDTDRDPENADPTLSLYANLTLADLSSNTADYDFLSNGFKSRNTSTDQNANGSTYLYMAFAENPFKYANAR